MRRGCGYCDNEDCIDYLKGVFLLKHGSLFYCPKCRERGFISEEIRVDYGTPNEVYKTVRVHFGFNPASRTHTEIGVVDIPELRLGGLYEIYSPLIRTEKRALQLAEVTLCALNSGVVDEEPGITVLNIDRDDWHTQLEKLEVLLGERERRVANALRQQ